MVSTSLQNRSFDCCSREVQPVALMSCFSDPSLMWSDLISKIKKFHCFQKTENHLLLQRQLPCSFEQAHLTSTSGQPSQSPCPLPLWWPAALARLQLPSWLAGTRAAAQPRPCTCQPFSLVLFLPVGSLFSVSTLSLTFL